MIQLIYLDKYSLMACKAIYKAASNLSYELGGQPIKDEVEDLQLKMIQLMRKECFHVLHYWHGYLAEWQEVKGTSYSKILVVRYLAKYHSAMEVIKFITA